MRISRQQVAENRERLLQVSTDLFREHGLDGIGVADLTKAAGMTAGSFYGYFDSKEQLIAEVTARGVRGVKDRYLEGLQRPVPEAFDRFVESYLSPRHVQNRTGGCFFAALGGEVTHQPSSVLHAATNEIDAMLAALEGPIPGDTPEAKRKHAIATLASMTGGLVLARMVDCPELSGQILAAVQEAVKRSVLQPKGDVGQAEVRARRKQSKQKTGDERGKA